MVKRIGRYVALFAAVLAVAPGLSGGRTATRAQSLPSGCTASGTQVSCTVTVPGTAGPASFGGTGMVYSGIDLASGGTAVLTATGTVNCTQPPANCPAGPVGSTQYIAVPGSPIPGVPAWGVMYQIDDGPYVAITSLPATITGVGSLTLGVNDNILGDNPGSFAVTVGYMPPDSTPPTASPTLNPAPNSAGWNNSDVTVTWNWSDGTDGSGIDPNHCTTSSTSSGEVMVTLTATCADNAGNASKAAVTVKVDKTPPQLNLTGPTVPASGWLRSAPATIEVQASDPNSVTDDRSSQGAGASKLGPGSLLASESCTDSLTGGSPTTLLSDTLVQQTFLAYPQLQGDGTHVVSCTMSDAAGNSTSSSLSVKIDSTAPTVTVTGVSDGAVYLLGTVPQAGCKTTDSLSGVAAQAAVSISGGNASGVGSFTAICSGGTDNAGNTAPPASVQYSVGYKFSGFLAPVSDAPTVNSGKAGRSYPVKFQLSNGSGGYISALSAVRSVTYQAVSCSSFSGGSDPLAADTAGNSGLQYDPTTHSYTYVWKTPSTAGCYTLMLTLDSGQTFTADFNLK